ncbi:hypothetical protein WJX72_002607 [[Myrmecia] bisecta]|uniref:rRNA 2'-O-methyltransferase fibrillarin n=1 Tax=[Myrmecia] bisecta TaxID=41462 RepID=A0AAW1PNF8_9CHLO
MLLPMVDVVFADVAQPDQARIVGLNAQYFLKNGGFFVISIKASCIDSTAPPEAVFAREVKKLQEQQLKPKEQVTLEPYERDHAMVVGVYRAPSKKADKQDLYDLPGADKITYQLKKSTQALKDVTPDLARDAREKFWGRLAVLIFAAVVVGERITGKGAVQQLELSATNIPIHKMEPLLGGVVILLLLAAFYPGRDKFSGPTLRRRVLKLWAWIQSLSGRLACLGLAGMIVAEVTTGKGALSLLNVETGKQALNEVEAGLAFLVMLFITGDVYKRRDEDWEEED